MYKIFTHWWQLRRIRFYRRSRWHLVIDLFLLTIILLLVGVLIRVTVYSPKIDTSSKPNIHPSSTPSVNKDLNINIKVSSPQSAIQEGEDIEIVLDYENNGDLIIEQAEFEIDMESSAFSIKGLVSDEKTVKNKITLNNIAINAPAQLKFKIKWEAGKDDFPRTIKSSLLAKIYSGDNQMQQVIDLPEINISSNLQVKASIYYHSPQGDQLGIGPLPPVVDVPTTYWLIVKAINSGNSLKNLSFSAQLPARVELSGEQSLLAGRYSYNQETRRLIWQVDSLEAVGGDYIANFALVLTPDDSQVGKNATLLKNIQYHADDVLTGNTISAQLSELDSSVPDDRLNRGNGAVVKE